MRIDHERTMRARLLVLADGSRVRGRADRRRRAGGVATGEVVFNTVLTGYQEVITDPSYAGQIITFTNPHIGNYGVNATDFESRRPFCRGVVVRDLARRHSNHRAEGDLDAMLARYGVPGIAGIDTRRLTRLIRDTGAMPGAFGTRRRSRRCSRPRPRRARHRRRSTSSPRSPRPSRTRSSARRAATAIVAYDFGIKRTILPPPRRARHGRGRAGVDAGRRRARPPARRRVPVQRSRRPGDGAVRRRGDRRAARRGADLRDLPRPPAARPGARRGHGQAAVRPPRRQPPGAAT